MRVLVVEDQPRMARLLKRGLEEEGHAVDLVADGPDGQRLAWEES
jgi:two-component system OmpR family response regulator